jgi:ketosteroid isomerase-like protein
MNDTQTLEARIRRLEDRAAIHELIGRYGVAMDDRDLDAFPGLFTTDCVIRSQDGVMNAAGLPVITELFRGRFKVLGPSNHFSHDKLITWNEQDPDRATGLVLSHAEMQRKDQPMLAAMRYRDKYRRDGGVWKFEERLLTFFYYVATAEYLDAFGAGIGKRMRAYDEHRPADWPEGLATWQKYHAD